MIVYLKKIKNDLQISSAFKLSETGALLFAAVLFTIFYAVTLCLAISNRILCHFVSLLFLFTSSCVLLLRFGTPAAVDSFRIDYCLFLAYTVAVLIHLLLQLFFKSVKSSQFKVGVLIQDATVVQHQCTAVQYTELKK